MFVMGRIGIGQSFLCRQSVCWQFGKKESGGLFKMCVACVFYKLRINTYATEEQEAEHNGKRQHLEHEYIDFLSMAVRGM